MDYRFPILPSRWDRLQSCVSFSYTPRLVVGIAEIHVEPAAPKPEPSAQVSSTPAPTPVRRAPSVRSGATTILDSLQGEWSLNL